MTGGETGACKGIIKMITPTDKGGKTVRISVRQSNGLHHTVFLNLFGKNAAKFVVPGESPENLDSKETYKVGDEIAAEWEVIQKKKLNQQTGKADGWVTYKDRFMFELLTPAENMVVPGAYKASNSAAPAAGKPAENQTAADDVNEDDTW